MAVLFALSSCQGHVAANLISNASRSVQPAKTDYGAPRQHFFTSKELFDLQNRFWKSFIYPANEKQANDLYPADNQNEIF